LLTRRQCLHLFAASGLYSLMPSLVVAAAPGDYRLVVVILRGAWDGLDVVRPHGDPAYAKLRPSAGGESASGTIDIDGFYGLHPSLAPLHPLVKSKELSFVHAVATPYRSRSHFEGQDILELGTAGETAESVGWLNRLLGLIGEARASYAVDVGPGSDIILRGPNHTTSWYPDLDLDLDLQNVSAQFLQAMYKGDPVLQSSFDEIQQAMGEGAQSDNMDQGVSARELAQLVGKFLNADARIAAFSVTGWDTHVGQDKRMPRQLKMLSDTLLMLKTTLGNNWQRTAVVMCSEFGRTARFNGTGGTDHGTGGLAVLAGGLLANGKGGRILGNKWPGLAEGQLYEDRDLKPTDDVRRYPAWLLASLFGLKPSQVADTVFPGLDMGDNLKLV
jgi:uncharacterized protein (DUF1501 family)